MTSGSNGGLFENYRKKFVREATNLSRLHHPNIINVLECFEANNTVYYAMEYLDGGSLDGLINKKHGLPGTEAIRYIRQIASALSYMHEHKVLHLDLKPGNIMLHNGNAVLIDFGLSKQYDENGNPESSTTIGGGTPGYAPLEQANYQEGMGFPAHMDIYALGATLFKMLTGQRPPDASDVLNDGLPDKPASTSAEVWAAIGAAMQPMRKKRPQTVEEWVRLLPNTGTVTPDNEATIVNVDKPRKPTPVKNIHEGHEYVDLGLSVKWATCNVGAERPEDYGDYFAWGETSTKAEYTEANSITYKKNMGDIAGNPQYDAARANWGGTWRLPTKVEYEELLSKCIWKWATQDGHKGYRVTSKTNGSSIFLPAAGYRHGTSLDDAGEDGNYWSSTPNEGDTENAYNLYFYSSYHSVYWYGRYRGRSVRPVSE